VARRAGSVSVDEPAKMIRDPFEQIGGRPIQLFDRIRPAKSMIRVCPTYEIAQTCPRSASTRFAQAAGVPSARNPSRGTLAAGCAGRQAVGNHAADR